MAQNVKPGTDRQPGQYRHCHGGPSRQPWADLASASISAVSAFSSLASTFCAFFIDRSIFAPMSDTPTTTRPALPGVEVLAQFLEIVAAHPGGRVTGHRAEHGTASGRGQQQAPADRREREQHHHQAGGQAYAAAEHAAWPGVGVSCFLVIFTFPSARRSITAAS